MMTGASGTATVAAVGVADLLVEAALDPPALDAFTVQVYAVPAVNPVTTKGLAVPVAVFVTPEAVQLAVKLVAVPPVAALVNASVICVLPAVAELSVGLVGTVVTPSTGITLTPPDAGPVPALLVAVTEQEYVLPLVRRVTTIGLPVPVLLAGVPVPTAHDAV